MNNIEFIKSKLRNAIDINYMAGVEGTLQSLEPAHAATLKRFAFEYAVAVSNQAVAERLIEAGYKDAGALKAAAELGNAAVFFMLLKHQKPMVKRKAPIDNSAKYTEIIHAAAVGDNKEILEYLVNNGANVNFLNYSCEPPLMLACKLGAKRSVEVLMQKGASPFFSYPGMISPIHWCVLHEKHDLLNLIIEHYQGEFFSNIDFCMYYLDNSRVFVAALEKNMRFDLAFADYSYGVLHYACAKGDLKLIAKLIETPKVDINHLSKFLGTPLAEAVNNEMYFAAELLLKNLACPDLSSDYMNKSPLIIAVKKKLYNFAKLLLNYGAKPDGVINSVFASPLYYAVLNNDFKMTKLLLKHGANPELQRDESKPPVLLLAARHGYNEILELIISFDANLKIKDRASGNTVLHEACGSQTLDYNSCIKTLLSFDVGLYAQNNRKQTAIDVAIDCKNFYNFQACLHYGYNDFFATKDDNIFKSKIFVQYLLIAQLNRPGFNNVDFLRQKWYVKNALNVNSTLFKIYNAIDANDLTKLKDLYKYLESRHICCLFYSIKQNKIRTTKFLLEQHEVKKHIADLHNLALRLAIGNKNLILVKLLLKFDAVISNLDTLYYCAISLAVNLRCDQIYRELQKHLTPKGYWPTGHLRAQNYYLYSNIIVYNTPYALNTAQLHNLNCYLDMLLEDVFNSSLQEQIIFYKNCNCIYVVKTKFVDELNEIKRILKHPCPQNRTTGSAYLFEDNEDGVVTEHGVSYVYSEPMGHNEFVAKERLGLLSLTAVNCDDEKVLQARRCHPGKDYKFCDPYYLRFNGLIADPGGMVRKKSVRLYILNYIEANIKTMAKNIILSKYRQYLSVRNTRKSADGITRVCKL